MYMESSIFHRYHLVYRCIASHIHLAVVWFPARLGATNITTSQDGQVYTVCNATSPFHADASFRADFINVTCNLPRLGRYVKIQRLPGSYQSYALTLCEVQVYGYQYEGEDLHIEAKIKWQPFCPRHFQGHFLPKKGEVWLKCHLNLLQSAIIHHWFR